MSLIPRDKWCGKDNDDDPLFDIKGKNDDADEKKMKKLAFLKEKSHSSEQGITVEGGTSIGSMLGNGVEVNARTIGLKQRRTRWSAK